MHPAAPPPTAFERFATAVAATAAALGITSATAHHRQGYFWTCYEHGGLLREVEPRKHRREALHTLEKAFILDSLTD